MRERSVESSPLRALEGWRIVRRLAAAGAGAGAAMLEAATARSASAGPFGAYLPDPRFRFLSAHALRCVQIIGRLRLALVLGG